MSSTSSPIWWAEKPQDSSLAVQQMQTSCSSFLFPNNKGQECWTNRDTHTHTAVHVPGHWGLEGNKDRTRCKRFSWTYQHACESLLQFARIGHGQFQRHVVSSEIRVLVHAPCVPHDSSLSNKYNFFTPPPSSLFYFLRKKNLRTAKKKKKGKISSLLLVVVFVLSRPSRAPFWILLLVTSSTLSTCEGGGVMRRVRAAVAAAEPLVRHFSRRNGRSNLTRSARTPFSSLLSVSCTISAPLPVGSNDDEHDSRLLQSPAVWEFSWVELASLIPPLLTS